MDGVVAQRTLKEGRYYPRQILGSGTYGQVIRCTDTVTGEDVAVKVAQREPAYRRAALNEMHVLQLLSNRKDTVQILDTFEEQGHVCIVSELLRKNLYEILRARDFEPLPLESARKIAIHVLRALAALHATGYIHCDVKPENVMVRHGDGGAPPSALPCAGAASCFHDTVTPCAARGAWAGATQEAAAQSVCDGGIAAPHGPVPAGCAGFSAAKGGLSGQGSGCVDFDGTCLIDFGAVRQLHENCYYDIQSLWYRAPEVICGLPYTPLIDSWSVGCLLFEMYTGKPLFAGANPQQQLDLITRTLGMPSAAALNGSNMATLAASHTPPVNASAQLRSLISSRGGVCAHRDDDLLIDLLARLLSTSEANRLSCADAIQHPFFAERDLSHIWRDRFSGMALRGCPSSSSSSSRGGSPLSNAGTALFLSSVAQGPPYGSPVTTSQLGPGAQPLSAIRIAYAPCGVVMTASLHSVADAATRAASLRAMLARNSVAQCNTTATTTTTTASGATGVVAHRFADVAAGGPFLAQVHGLVEGVASMMGTVVEREGSCPLAHQQQPQPQLPPPPPQQQHQQPCVPSLGYCGTTVSPGAFHGPYPLSQWQVAQPMPPPQYCCDTGVNQPNASTVFSAQPVVGSVVHLSTLSNGTPMLQLERGGVAGSCILSPDDNRGSGAEHFNSVVSHPSSSERQTVVESPFISFPPASAMPTGIRNSPTNVRFYTAVEPVSGSIYHPPPQRPVQDVAVPPKRHGPPALLGPPGATNGSLLAQRIYADGRVAAAVKMEGGVLHYTMPTCQPQRNPHCGLAASQPLPPLAPVVYLHSYAPVPLAPCAVRSLRAAQPFA